MSQINPLTESEIHKKKPEPKIEIPEINLKNIFDSNQITPDKEAEEIKNEYKRDVFNTVTTLEVQQSMTIEKKNDLKPSKSEQNRL